jgi:hypothetical protein
LKVAPKWISKVRNVEENKEESNQEGTVDKKGLFLKERIKIVNICMLLA